MRIKLIVILALTAITALALPVAAEAGKRKKPPKVTVMTRNVYLGSDLEPAYNPPPANAIEFAEEAGKIYRNVQETNFVARAKPLAKEIDEANADLVGLQEVALWRRDTAGAPDGDATPATEVVYDFLHQLRSELRERGLEYRIASVQQEADLEFPLDFNDNSSPEFAYDGRLTMRDVILAKDKRRLKTRNEQSENYNLNASLTIDLAPPGPGGGDQTIEFTRGYNAVDVVKKRKGKKKGNASAAGDASAAGKKKRRAKTKFRFVNTHLESVSAFFRNAQASELVVHAANPLQGKVIVVGDLNSDPDDPTVQGPPFSPPPGTANAAAYQRFTDAGFVDVGVSENTCCHANSLLNPPPAAFTSRIDHILSKPAVERRAGALTGDDASERTPTGLWPSDHGGQWAKLKVK